MLILLKKPTCIPPTRLISLFVIFTAYAGIGWSSISPAETAEIPVSENEAKLAEPPVILISIDTLRPDHLGCYGYSRETTPHIDDFSRDAVLFKEVIAQAPYTLASHASLFTALIPSHHEAVFESFPLKPNDLFRYVPGINRRLSPNNLTMAEILKNEGYHTVSFNDSGQVSAEFGFDQGFDEYHENKDAIRGKFKDTVRRATAWLKKNGSQKFFLFLHTYETHDPFTPAQDILRKYEPDLPRDLPATISYVYLNSINTGKTHITAREQQHIMNLYDAEIFSMDLAFGALIDYLKKNRLYDNTVILFTSDHGEAFGEHGKFGHGKSLYDEELKVPLIIKFPNSAHAGQRVDAQVRSIDVLPTLLEILNIVSPAPGTGGSLMPAAGRKNQEERFYAVSELGPTASLRTGEWKLYHSKLFNLKADPNETVDTAMRHPFIKSCLRNKLTGLLNGPATPPPPSDNDLKIKQKTLDQLRSLGYL